jgi:hypothetical protein
MTAPADDRVGWGKTPTPAVMPMASASQKVTRITLGIKLAPPAHAVNAPRRARKISEVPETKIIRVVTGANAETMSGVASPAAKLPADMNLNRTRFQSFRDAEFVAGMRAYGVVGHELIGNLFRE